jgi:choline dehydrogenase
MSAGSYDYVIVGAGSAGCVLAGRLSTDPACRVALLEAGGSDRKREIRIPAGFTKLFQTSYDWNYRTSKQPQLSDRELYWPRGKTLGGSSSINGQAWTRGHSADYDGWSHSCPGWSYGEVLPYFRRAERRVGSNAGGVYGTSGPQFISELRDPNPTTLAFLAACAEVGMRRPGEVNEPDNTGYALTPVSQRRGLRNSAADAYLHPARRRCNMTVLTGAYTQRILLDGARATGVEYRDASGVTQRVTATREVILSAGTINSPQLLMLSGIGEPDQLRAAGVETRHELAGVGANLQDHLACAVTVHCPKPVTLVAADSPRQLARFLLLRRGMLTSSVNEAVAFVRSDPALAAPDIELVWLPVWRIPPDEQTLWIGAEFVFPELEKRGGSGATVPAAATLGAQAGMIGAVDLAQQATPTWYWLYMFSPCHKCLKMLLRFVGCEEDHFEGGSASPVICRSRYGKKLLTTGFATPAVKLDWPAGAILTSVAGQLASILGHSMARISPQEDIARDHRTSLATGITTRRRGPCADLRRSGSRLDRRDGAAVRRTALAAR